MSGRLMESTEVAELLEGIQVLLVEGDLVGARRAMLRASAVVGEEGDRAVLQACQVAALVLADEDPPQLEPKAYTPKSLCHLACTLSDLGEQTGVLTLLRLADGLFAGSEFTADDGILLANHAIILDRLGDTTAAIACFERSHELEPELAGNLLEWAAALNRADRFTESAAVLRRHLEREPDDAHSWISLAVVESDAGNYEQAQRAYWRAAGIEPDNASLHFNWLITAKRLENPELALDALRRLRAVAAEDWRTRLAGAWDLADNGEPRLALTQLTELLSQTPQGESHAAYIAATALRTARQSDLPADSCSQVIEAIFERELFDEDVLRELRQRDGELAEGVRYFKVLVKGRTADSAYFISLHVLAQNAARAVEAAVAFERRCGGVEVGAEDTEEVEQPPSKAWTGVLWRADSRAFFPIEEWNGED